MPPGQVTSILVAEEQGVRGRGGGAGDQPAPHSVLCVPARVLVATGARLVCASEADRRDTITVCVLFFKERAVLTSL